MIVVSFTGEAKKLTATEKELVDETIGGLGDVDRFFNGAARGTDVYAGWRAMVHFPEAKHFILIPQFAPARAAPPGPCRYDRAGVSYLNKYAVEEGIWLKWIWARPGYPKQSDGYLQRDDDLAEACTHMIAFPETPKELQRGSGTWATVRRGRNRERRILVVPLDGSESWKEG